MEGFLSLVITAHVPYVRATSRHAQGDELLHETIAFGLIPLLNTLCDLRDAGQATPIGIAFSPILLEQLAHPDVGDHFREWMSAWLNTRADALARWQRQGADHTSYLAQFDLEWGRSILASFDQRFHGDLITPLRDLCADLAEPLAGAATHAYLPLVQHPASLTAQLQVGTAAVARRLGRAPAGLWLPECGFHPRLYPAIRASAATYVVVDSASMGAEEPTVHPRWAVPERLQVLVRDRNTAALIWSPELGYSGDPVYRSTRRDPRAGMALWRNGMGEDEALLYDPYDAFRRAEEDAGQFLVAVAGALMQAAEVHERPGIALVPIDLELIGRRWFEGQAWLRSVLMRSIQGEGPGLAAPSDYLRTYHPLDLAPLQEGSWGPGGDHRAWQSQAARPIWQAIGEAEERLADLLQQQHPPELITTHALNQALRELLIAQSSDWPLLAGLGYLEEPLRRVRQHLERCERLCQMVEGIEPFDQSYLQMLERIDNPFPFLHHSVFTDVTAIGYDRS
jgi:1,4-alpha-glucan branching enzyme